MGLPSERFIVVENAGHADVLYADPGATTTCLTQFFLRTGAEPGRSGVEP